MCTLCEILSRRRDDKRRNAQRLFRSIVSFGFPGLRFLKTMEFCVGVATRGVGSPASCLVASVCSCLETMSRKYATLGVGLPTFPFGFASFMLMCAKCEILIVRRIRSVVSFGFPRPVYDICEILIRRRGARRHFASVLSGGFPKLMYAFYSLECRRGAPRRFASVLSCGFPELRYAKYRILCRLRDDWRLDAQHRFVSIVSCGVSRLLLA
jgi:hypothetical protein